MRAAADAALHPRARSSAVQLGYWDDPFLRFFVRRPTRRPPLINRGAHAARGSTVAACYLSHQTLTLRALRRNLLGAAGYYARVAAIRQLVLRFLAAGGDAERAPPAKQARRRRQSGSVKDVRSRSPSPPGGFAGRGV